LLWLIRACCPTATVWSGRRRGCGRRAATGPWARGQAILEAVLILPLFILIVLGILQLTQIEHARIMTEYAAFSAARAGIVWNGSNERMRDAALLALLPTFGRTDSTRELEQTWRRQRATDEQISALPWGAPRNISGTPLDGMVRVDTIAPASSDELGRIWNLPDGDDWEELDFDAAYTYPEAPGLSRHFQSFERPGAGDDEQELYRRANVLSIRVRYWYELRIPIANWFLFVCWYASHANATLRGAVDRPTLDASETAVNRRGDLQGLEHLASGIGNQRGFPTAHPSEMDLLWRLSTGQASFGTGNARRFFIPLSATYTMRMQSNFYRRWLMH
jgi:hypothetical protein